MPSSPVQDAVLKAMPRSTTGKDHPFWPVSFIAEYARQPCNSSITGLTQLEDGQTRQALEKLYERGLVRKLHQGPRSVVYGLVDDAD